MQLPIYSGAGNRFALLDALDGQGGGELDARREEDLARAFAAAAGDLDGLLVLAPPRSGGDTRLAILNRDGSRAESCGNGLRCVALHLVRHGRAAGATLSIETDAGPRTAELLERGADAARVRVGMGAARVFPLTSPVEHDGRRLEAVGVEVGNPHCVLFVEDERAEPLEELGPALQSHPDFPAGVNVGLVAERDGGFHLRVWERGVGETAACGSGACAAACALVAAGRAHFPLELRAPGGALTVERDAAGALLLTGEARAEAGLLEIEPGCGR